MIQRKVRYDLSYGAAFNNKWSNHAVGNRILTPEVWVHKTKRLFEPMDWDKNWYIIYSKIT